MAPIVWLSDADAIQVAFAGTAPFTVRPAALVREWCAIVAKPAGRRGPDGADPWRDHRYFLLTVYPELVGRN